jgi:hypothetical protein
MQRAYQWPMVIQIKKWMYVPKNMDMMDTFNTAASRCRLLISRATAAPMGSPERMRAAVLVFEYVTTHGRCLLEYAKMRSALLGRLKEFAQQKSFQKAAAFYSSRIIELSKRGAFAYARL